MVSVLVHSANAFSLSYYGWGLEDDDLHTNALLLSYHGWDLEADDVNTCSQRFSPLSQRALTVLPWLGP